MAKISLVSCESYQYTEVRSAVISLLAPLGGLQAFLSSGETVLLKPNLLSAKAPEAAVTTHPILVKVVAELAKELGCKVLIGDSPGIGSFRKVADKSGISQIALESGAELVEFNSVVELAGGGQFRRIDIAEAYWKADKIINLPKLKTHEMMTMTCAVKNLFGAVVGGEKAAWHLKAGTSQAQFARLLLEIYLLKKPVLNIVDAIVAMEGNGPNSGDPITVGVLIAGGNAVEVDIVAARLAGIPPELLYVEREAIKMNLDGSGIHEVETVGTALESLGKRSFRLPSTMDVQFGLPSFIKKSLKRYLTSFPVADKKRCILCGICRDACPPKAITIKNSSLAVNQESCIRCWCCRELCPHDAMLIHQGAVLKLLKKVRKRC